jgi:hypothetical protein
LPDNAGVEQVDFVVGDPVHREARTGLPARQSRPTRASLARPLGHTHEKDHLVTECDRPRVERADDLEILARRAQVAGPTQTGVEQAADHGLTAAAMRLALIASARDARPFSSRERVGGNSSTTRAGVGIVVVAGLLSCIGVLLCPLWAAQNHESGPEYSPPFLIRPSTKFGYSSL